MNGNLELVQKSPIPSTSITSMSYYITNPFKTGYNEASPFDLLYHYNKYKSHNYTIKYNYEKLERKRIQTNTAIRSTSETLGELIMPAESLLLPSDKWETEIG